MRSPQRALLVGFLGLGLLVAIVTWVARGLGSRDSPAVPQEGLLSRGPATDEASRRPLPDAPSSMRAGSDVRGTVRDAVSSEPIVGAEIVLSNSGEALARSTSDDSGRFDLGDCGSGGSVRASCEGYCSIERRLDDVPVDERRSLDLALPRSARLYVQVRDASGNGVYPATVRVNPAVGAGWEVPTVEAGAATAPVGEDGVAVLDGLPAEWPLHCTAEARGLVTRAATAEIAAHDRTGRVTIVLTAAGRLAGTIVSPSGRGLEGVRVVCRAAASEGGGHRFVATTDPQGSFRFDDVPAGWARLELERAPDTGTDARVEAGQETLVPPIETELERNLRGRVVGDCATSARWTIAVEREGMRLFESVTDEEGWFEVRAPHGAISLVARSVLSELEPLRTAPLGEWHGEPGDTVELALLSRHGRIVTRVPASFAGQTADVGLVARTADKRLVFRGEHGRSWFWARVGDDGCLVIDCIEPGRYDVLIRAGDESSWIVDCVIEPGDTLDLGAASFSRGAIVAALEGDVVRPSVQCRPVMLPPGQAGSSDWATDNASGTHHLRNLRPGPYVLTIVDEACGPGPGRPVDVLPGASSEVRLETDCGASIAGRVAGFDDPTVVVRSDALGASRRVQKPDREGAFEFRSLRPGRYTVMVDGQSARVVDLSAGERVWVELRRSETVRVRLVGLEPAPRIQRAGVLGRAGAGDEPQFAKVQVESDGSLVVPRLPGISLLVCVAQGFEAPLAARVPSMDTRETIEVTPELFELTLSAREDWQGSSASLSLMEIDGVPLDAFSPGGVTLPPSRDRRRTLLLPSPGTVLIRSVGDDGRTFERRIEYGSQSARTIEWP